MKSIKVGEVLRCWREQLGISQRELQRQMGLGVGHWSHVEAGERSPALGLVAQAGTILEGEVDVVQCLLTATLGERMLREVAEYIRVRGQLPASEHPVAVSLSTLNSLLSDLRSSNLLQLKASLEDDDGWKGWEVRLYAPDDKTTPYARWVYDSDSILKAQAAPVE